METQLQQKSLYPRIAGNTNTALLKTIAIICMLIDHAGVAFFPGVTEMRLIGRIAFPLFAWCVVVGAEYTRNIWRYALRLLLVGLIAQPCYVWGLNHKWHEFNIFATLLLGLFSIAGIQQKKFFSHIWAPVLCLLLSCIIYVDYSWEGVLLILVLYAARQQKGALAAVMGCFCLFWGQGTFNIASILGVKIPTRYAFLPEGYKLTMAISKIQFGAILALPLMLIPMHIKIRLPKWIAYSAYPAHLLIFGFIRHWDQVQQLFQGLFQ